MSLIPELSNPYLTSFASGLLYGLVACTATCLPYLASYIAGTGAGFRKGVLTTLTFNSGRIIAYTLIGALIGVFSGLVHFFAEDSAVSIFQTYSTIAFSIVTIIIGLSLLYKNRKPSCECNQPSIPPKRKFIGRFDVGAFTLGLSRGLVLCPPLFALLLYSVPFASPVDSVAFAVLFGFGTAISPMLLLGGVTGWLLNKAPLLRKYVAIAGAAVLILLGLSTLINSLLILA
ncbi:MAG: sulfite exporter TauE/SafE family protein [Candidatus Bathyarchaeia archaeon]|jgi:thiol:disulfide interchange protein DsbD